MEPDRLTAIVTSIVTRIADRCPISCDRLTLGAHPDARRREEGYLGLIDWALPGGHLVDVDDDGPALEFVRRVGPLRAIGAALLAADKYAPACAREAELCRVATEADRIRREVPGGPDDPVLAMGLAARAAAIARLGARGEHVPALDWRGRECGWTNSYGRPEALLAIEPYDFDDLTAIALAPVQDYDRALLGPNPLPAAPLLSALERTLERAGWQIGAVDVDLVRRTARIELRSGNRLVTFDARNGRAVTTRELVDIQTEKRGRRGDIYRSECIHMRLMGREKHGDAASGLAWLADYIAENSSTALPAGEVRAMLAPVLALPV